MEGDRKICDWEFKLLTLSLRLKDKVFQAEVDLLIFLFNLARIWTFGTSGGAMILLGVKASEGSSILMDLELGVAESSSSSIGMGAGRFLDLGLNTVTEDLYVR